MILLKWRCCCSRSEASTKIPHFNNILHDTDAFGVICILSGKIPGHIYRNWIFESWNVHIQLNKQCQIIYESVGTSLYTWEWFIDFSLVHILI